MADRWRWRARVRFTPFRSSRSARDDSGHQMNRAAVRVSLVLTLALPMIYFTVNWADRQGDHESLNSYDPHRPPGRILVADRFGAVAQSRVEGLRGLRRDGSTAWTMSRKTLKSSAKTPTLSSKNYTSIAMANEASGKFNPDPPNPTAQPSFHDFTYTRTNAFAVSLPSNTVNVRSCVEVWLTYLPPQRVIVGESEVATSLGAAPSRESVQM